MILVHAVIGIPDNIQCIDLDGDVGVTGVCIEQHFLLSTTLLTLIPRNVGQAEMCTVQN